MLFAIISRTNVLHNRTLGILDAALYVKNYQQNEYRVTVNLFSKDKSAYEEATDWSYNNELSQEIFKEFLAKSIYLDIPVSLYDE